MKETPESSNSSSWSTLPEDVIWKLVSSCGRTEAQKGIAASFHLVNKHWRDAIGKYVSIVNPKKSLPLTLENAKALAQFPNVRTLVLRNSQVNGRNWSLTSVLSSMSSVRRLKISNPGRLEPIVSGFRAAKRLEYLLVENICLSDVVVEEHLGKLTSLKSLRLRCNSIASGEKVCKFLKVMSQLEVLEMPFPLKSYADCADFSFLDNLQYLRFYCSDCTSSQMQSLSGLTALTCLVLEGKLDDDVCISGLPQLKQLTVCSNKVPHWLGQLVQLKSLALEACANNASERRQNALLAVMSHLTHLSALLQDMKPSVMSKVIAAGKELRKLEVTNKHWNLDGLENCYMITDLELKPLSKWRKLSQDKSAFKKLNQLLMMRSLSLSLELPSPGLLSNFTEENVIASKVTKLVVTQMAPEDQKIVLQHFPRLTEWRLQNVASISGLVCGDHGCLPLLKNLCFVDTIIIDRSEFLDTLLRLRFLTRLSHLAIPPRSVSTEEHRQKIFIFLKQAPQVIIDFDFNWDPNPFK